MADIIRQLPDSLANKIAAGEVVQRPASVVKELLENSIDSGAKNITLVVKESGKSLIQVTDDGKGMSISDARFCFERHATSKIKDADDLYAIKTMGFRGEALASIAAVSRVELITNQNGSDLGTKVKVEGAEFKGQEPEASDKGTSIVVKNLFYNIPARRKFLKSDPVEMRHIMDDFQRIAISNPDLSFDFFNSDLQVFSLRPENLQKRIIHILGKSYQKGMLPCQEETEYLRIDGFVGTPQMAKKTRGDQFFFVNGRYVKNNYFQHAIKTAFEGLIPADHFPSFVLFLELDPGHVDVNVHPSKHEVKFDDERSVYGLIQAAVKKALGSHHTSPSLDFTRKVEPDQFQGSERSFSSSFQSGDSSLSGFDQGINISNQEKLDPITRVFQSKPESFGNPVSWDQLESSPQNHEAPGKLELQAKAFMQISGAFILVPIKSGALIMDQSKAHERILYERFLTRLENKNKASQQSLFPERISLGKADIHLLMGMEMEIKALGFDFEYSGQDAIVITGVPEGSQNENEKELFEGLLELYKENSKELNISKTENLVRALAKKSALPHGRKIEQEEASNLLDELFACKVPQYSPDGNPTFVKIGYNYLLSLFSENSPDV